MDAVVYSNFRNNLKEYMRKVNDEFTPLMVVNKNPEEDIVVFSKAHWESIQETIRVINNAYLSDKLMRGLEEIEAGKVEAHELFEV